MFVYEHARLVWPRSGTSINWSILSAILFLSETAVLAQASSTLEEFEVRQESKVLLSVDLDGTRPFVFQWRKDGVPIAGATSDILALANLLPQDSGIYDVEVRNPIGRVISSAVRLTVPTIILQPVGQSISMGEKVTLSVVANSGTDDLLEYQWRRNGIDIPGATGDVLNIEAATAKSFGNYTVLVKTRIASILSKSALLHDQRVTQTPPVIVRQPSGGAIQIGAPLILSVSATGSPQPDYQWRRNGVNITGANAETLVMEAGLAGEYSVSISNSRGTIVSTGAPVTLVRGASRIVNISSRGSSGPEGRSLITGFAVSGPLPQRLLLRSVGPTLTAFGVVDALEDPLLKLYGPNGQLVESDDDWGSNTANASSVRTFGAAVGAFPLISGSADAAIVTAVSIGAHTIVTLPVGSSRGEAITEIYDLEPENSTGSRLMNLSRSDIIEPDGGTITSGFVVSGSSYKTVLVRTVGPSLRLFGITDAIARPSVKIFDSRGLLIVSNAAWESTGISTDLIAISARTGAFQLIRGSEDSCVLASLPAGNYTVIVGATDNSGGKVLLELYDVP